MVDLGGSPVDDKHHTVENPSVQLGASFGAPTDFASKCAKAQADITSLGNAVTTTAKDRENDPSNPTADSISKQMTEDSNLADQYSTLSNTISTLASTPNITDPDKAQLAIMTNTLNTLGTQIVGLTAETSMQLATFAMDNAAPYFADTPYNNASNPTPPSPPASSTGSSGELPPQDGPNMFLATSLMAIMFKVELNLVQQNIQNMDAERQVKEQGFQNYMEFAKVDAEATYNKDMDQAAIYSNQATCSFMGAGLSLGMGLFSMAASGKMMEENSESKTILNDNPAFTKALNEKFPTARTKPEEFLPTLDKNKQPMPQAGIKQIEEEIAAATSVRDKLKPPTGSSVADPSTTTKIEQLNTKITQMTQERDKRIEQYQGINVNMMQSMKTQAKLNFLSQTAPQVINSTVQGIENSINAGIQIKLANDEAVAVIANAAMSIAQQYLQSAMDAFKSEGQNIQGIIEFLMSAASKNTQWSSIRA